MGLVVVGLAHGEFDHGVLDFFERGAAFGDVEAGEEASVGQGLGGFGGGGAFEGGASAGVADGEGEIDGAEERLVFEDHAALDGIFQFADVARPVVMEQEAAGFVGECREWIF